jgi:hypothetical protein
MSLQLEWNATSSTDVFLVAGGPPSRLILRTLDGTSQTVAVSISGPMASQVQLSASSVTANPAGATIDVTATAASSSQGDILLEASVSGAVAGALTITAIQLPSLQFEGRFQCRLSTDPDGFNNPWGQFSSFGMYAVEGPNPAHPAEPPLDRIIRFQNPVALRSLCPAVGVFVRRVRGTLANGTLVSFASGDPVIGLPVELGPQCVFDAQDGVFAQPGFEPISDFSIRIGNVFSGASEPALPRPNPAAPPPSNAPYADGVLRADMVSALRPADFGYPDANWTARASRIVSEKAMALGGQVAATPDEVAIRNRRITEHGTNAGGIQFALRLIERYRGIVDQNLSLSSTASPVLADWASRAQFPFYAEFLDFDTDCQCGTVWGTLGE